MVSPGISLLAYYVGLGIGWENYEELIWKLHGGTTCIHKTKTHILRRNVRSYSSYIGIYTHATYKQAHMYV